MRVLPAETAAFVLDERGQSSGVLAISTLRTRRGVDRVPSYLVETYLARGNKGVRAARERRARWAAEELTREGTRVRFEGSIHLPEGEICFFTFEAASGREAAIVAQRAELGALRVVEAVPSR